MSDQPGSRREGRPEESGYANVAGGEGRGGGAVGAEGPRGVAPDAGRRDAEVARVSAAEASGPVDPAVRAAARAGISPLSMAATAMVTDGPVIDDEIGVDDPDADDDGLVGAELLARELGAQVIGEYDEPR